MNVERWKKLMRKLSISSNTDVFDELVSAYSQKHRYYHTAEHIDHCLGLLDEYSDSATKLGEIEIAIWFHDAIYKPTSKDNEAKSAEWAMNFLLTNGCSRDTGDCVRGLIMATIHDASATDPDTQLLVDIDLSILGSDLGSYDQFETNVRREYKWVPAPIYRRERRKILQSFLDREAIYSTAQLHKQLEDRARTNLERAIEDL